MIIQNAAGTPLTITLENEDELKVIYGLLNMNSTKSYDKYMIEKDYNREKALAIRGKIFEQIYTLNGDVDSGGLK